MNRVLKTITVFVLTVVMAAGSFSLQSFAAEENRPSVKTGTYRYNSIVGGFTQETDTFVYRDDCFMHSSFLGCDHLEVLSAQTALASIGYFDSKASFDRLEHLIPMLKDMGFEDVENNIYDWSEKRSMTALATVGHKTINANGKAYTLLAIMPRGAGYRIEWDGNFTVGKGKLHEGFKAGRDEILRYLKQYMSRYQIEGDLKVWIAGHSRGAAISNLLGGFFAGGGIAYFGDRVRIEPQDVYCYTFATPGTIMEGLSKAEELSVAGSRDDGYPDETPGEAFVYQGEGEVSPLNEQYGGIRNYIFSYDLIPCFPSGSWNYTRYGSVYDLTEGVSEEGMRKELKTVSPWIYRNYLNNADPAGFQEAIPDLPNLAFTADGASGKEAMAAFVHQRADALQRFISSNQAYAESGAQDGLSSLAGYYGMVFAIGEIQSQLTENLSDFVKPGIYGYFAYASERLQEEGRASGEAAAIAIVLEEMLSFLTDREISETCSFDNFFELLATFVAENETSPAVQMLKERLVGFFAEKPTIASVIKARFKRFLPSAAADAAGKKGDAFVAAESVIATIIACARGADPTSSAGEGFENPYTVRCWLYEQGPLLERTLGFRGVSSKIGNDGSGSFSDVIAALLPVFLKGKDAKGKEIQYASFAAAADAELSAFMERIGERASSVVEARGLYNETLKGELNECYRLIIKNVSSIRRLLIVFLLYTEGETYSTEKCIRNISTIIQNFMTIPCAHYIEVYASWAKARQKEKPGEYTEYMKATKSTCKAYGNVECWCVHSSAGDTYYSDEGKTKKLEDPFLPAGSHTPGGEIQEITGETESGRVISYDAVVLCETCGQELSREPHVLLTDIQTEPLQVSSVIYNGKAQEPVVTLDGKALKRGTDYQATFKNNKNAGTAQITILGIGRFYGSVTKSFRIQKAYNPVAVTKTKIKVNTAKMRNGKQTVRLSVNVKEKAKKTFRRVSVPKKAKKYIAVSKNGKITVKKGLKKGTYKIKVRVTTAETKNYRKTSKTKTIRITVR